MKPAFITMDVESFYDTGCIKQKGISGERSCVEQIDLFLDMLVEFGAKGTFFVTVDFLGECKPMLMRAMAEGHEIALHALTHETPRGYSVGQFRHSISLAQKRLQDELGVTVKGYRAPCFGIDGGKAEILKELGFLYDSSALNFRAAYGAGYLDLGGYEKINDCVYRDGDFFEVRPTTLSGGGYLRLAPWAPIRRKLDRYFKKTDGYVFYVHPFELYGGELPKFRQLSALERVFVNRGRNKYPQKAQYIWGRLRQEGFTFTTVSDYLKSESGNE